MQDLTITLIQAHLAWEDADINLSSLEKKIQGINSGTDLIILPEMFTTGFTMNPDNFAEPNEGKTSQWMRVNAEKSNSVILGSIIVAEKNKYYNRLMVVFPDGSLQYYDKKHLFAYAGEHKSYSAGEERLIFEWKGWKICPMICYDLRFPAWSRNHYNKLSEHVDYDLLLYVANWPKPRIKAWDTLLSARAVENQTYVAGVNRIGTDANGNEYIGHSAVYDYLGETMGSLKEKEGILTLKLLAENQSNFRSKLPFLEDGDRFTFDE